MTTILTSIRASIGHSVENGELFTLRAFHLVREAELFDSFKALVVCTKLSPEFSEAEFIIHSLILTHLLLVVKG